MSMTPLTRLLCAFSISAPPTTASGLCVIAARAAVTANSCSRVVAVAVSRSRSGVVESLRGGKKSVFLVVDGLSRTDITESSNISS